MDPKRALAEAVERGRQRKLLIEYARIYDASRPFGPDNVGAYPWQAEFHNAGKDNTERLLIKANRVGGTQCAAAEMACHLTGLYPPWWKGRRFDHPIKAWTGAQTTQGSRDIIQLALLGEQGEHGTGWIPKNKILKVTYQQAGVSEVVDTIRVRHKTGGISVVGCKMYKQERKGWEGTKKDAIWLDEEPPMDIYTEALTRIMDSKGIIFLTFTPLIGASEVVNHFLNPQSEGIYVKNVTWDDAPHLSEEEREKYWNSYPEHERETRASGQPLLGTGVVFPILDQEIACDPFEFPNYFARINGVDFGIDHPAAGVTCGWDRDQNIFYVGGGYRKSGETAVYHAEAMKGFGDWIPTAWPHDGMQRDKGSGKTLKDQYRSHGVRMLPEPASYDGPRHSRPDTESVEPALIEMLEWMRAGRFKVFSTFREWFEEKRMYHRKDGLVVKKMDDIMAATRYAFIMRRKARTKPSGTRIRRAPRRPIVSGTPLRRAG